MNETDKASFSNNFTLSGWAEVLNIIILSAVVILGVLGNGIIIIVQLKNREKSSTDYFVGTMAVFELFCAGFNSLIVVFNNISGLWYVIATLTLCSIRAYSSLVATISSTLLLTAIAIDRYILTCKPFNTCYSKQKAKWICIGVIVISIVSSTPSLALATFDDENMKCLQTVKNPVLHNILQMSLGATYVVMFVVVIFCYSKVTILIRRRHKQRINNVPLTSASTSKHSTVSIKLSSKARFVKNKNKIAPKHQCKGIEIATVENSLKPASTGQETDLDLKRTIRDKEEVVRISDTEIQALEMQKINRTTLIMFLITTIYILTWVIHWLNNALVSRDTVAGRNVIHLTTYLYMINCVTNPIFFIAMSSKFRRNAKILFTRIINVCRSSRQY
jgi:hypothetical protein